MENRRLARSGASPRERRVHLDTEHDVKVGPVTGRVGSKSQGSADAAGGRIEQHENPQPGTFGLQEEVGAVIGGAGICEAWKERLVAPSDPVAGVGQLAPNAGVVLHDVPQAPAPHGGATVEIVALQARANAKRAHWRGRDREPGAPIAVRGVAVVPGKVHEVMPAKGHHVRIERVDGIEGARSRRQQQPPSAHRLPQRAGARLSIGKTCRRRTAPHQEQGQNHRRRRDLIAAEPHEPNRQSRRHDVERICRASYLRSHIAGFGRSSDFGESQSIGHIDYLDPILVEDQEPLGDSAKSAWRPRPTGSRRWSRRPRLLLNVMTVLVTLVFSYIALRNINFSLAWRALRTSDYWWLGAALIAFALGIAARALRWRSLFAR